MVNIGGDITRRLIESAGIKTGMKILDLGCGNGEVTFLLSNYVGTDGYVLGIDNSENAITTAKNKSKELGLSNLHFSVKNLTQDFIIDHSDFDAIIVRRVLMYLPNSQKTIKTAIRYLKPNGIFLAQENNISRTPIGLESMPKHKKIIDLIRKTLEEENVNLNMGFELNTILTDAGLKVEKIWAEAVLSTQNQQTPWAFLAQVMKERMLANKVIRDISELELDTLSNNLADERMRNNKAFISDLVFCAVAKVIK